MWKKKGHCSGVECYVILLTYLLSCVVVHAEAGMRASGPPLVKKEERWAVVSTDYGQISAVRLNDGFNGTYLLHFFSFEPNSILLPLILNADMILYVQAGSGRLSWTEEEEAKQIDLRRGDVYRLLRGTVFYIITNDSEAQQQQQQQRLKIHAIFANSNDNLREPEAEQPYSSIQDVVLGFDKNILQATFKVSEEVIDELLGGTKPPAITNLGTFCRGFSESRSCNILETTNKKKNKDKEKEKKEKEKKKEKEEEEEEKGKKHARLFNLFEVEKEIENCHGWTTSVSKKQLPALEGSNIGVFMVNLKAGSLMEPRWNTIDTEIVVVVEGRGVVRMSNPKERGGRNMRFGVDEGDVFAAPRFQPMAEMAFNNGSFVFMGFSMMSERSKDQSIAGEFSVLRLLNKDVLGVLFNIKRTTLDKILAPRDQTGISACISCAEEEMKTEGREEETGGRHGGEEERGREGETGRRHGGDEKRWWGEEEERGRRHGGDEEKAGWRRGGEEEEGGRQHEGRDEKREPQLQNYHNYEQGGRRILKRN